MTVNPDELPDYLALEETDATFVFVPLEEAEEEVMGSSYVPPEEPVESDPDIGAETEPEETTTHDVEIADQETEQADIGLVLIELLEDGAPEIVFGLERRFLEGEAARGTYVGSTEDDVFTFADSFVSLHAGSGDDVFTLSGGSGSIRAGDGNDSLMLIDWRGVVDLGSDDDSDVVILIDSPHVQFTNLDSERDIIIHVSSRGDEVA